MACACCAYILPAIPHVMVQSPLSHTVSGLTMCCCTACRAAPRISVAAVLYRVGSVYSIVRFVSSV